MSDVKELIEKARRHVSDGVGGGVALAHELADALEVEHDEVERLRGELHQANVAERMAVKRAERAEAERDEYRAYKLSVADLLTDNARLTAQLQAIERAYAAEAELDRQRSMHTTAIEANARLTAQLQAIERAWAARTGWSEFGTQVRAILDAAADKPKRMICPGCGHEVYRDPMEGWRNDSDGFTCDPPRTTHAEHILGGE